MQRKFNYIFTILVKNDEDLLGLLSYCQYKNQKIEYIKKIKEQNNKEPSEDDLNIFHQISSQDSTIEVYKAAGLQKLQNITNEIIKSNLEIINSEANKSAYKGRMRALKDLKPSWLHGIISSIAGNVLFYLLIAIVIIVSKAMDYDIVGKLIKLLSVTNF